MSTVLYPTRAGDPAYRNQDRVVILAQERDEKAGARVESICLHGAFRQALGETIEGRNVMTVVLGRPTHDTALTTIEYISELARALSASYGIEVFVVQDGHFVEHYQPSQDGE